MQQLQHLKIKENFVDSLRFAKQITFQQKEILTHNSINLKRNLAGMARPKVEESAKDEGEKEAKDLVYQRQLEKKNKKKTKQKKLQLKKIVQKNKILKLKFFTFMYFRELSVRREQESEEKEGEDEKDNTYLNLICI